MSWTALGLTGSGASAARPLSARCLPGRPFRPLYITFAERPDIMSLTIRLDPADNVVTATRT
ncbi:MAG: hypothetical protein ACON37_07590, partial [Candidatus Puniceispirillaceae bacterium]